MFGYLRNTWSLRSLAKCLTNELCIPISFKHLQRITKDLGIRCKRPKLEEFLQTLSLQLHNNLLYQYLMVNVDHDPIGMITIFILVVSFSISFQLNSSHKIALLLLLIILCERAKNLTLSIKTRHLDLSKKMSYLTVSMCQHNKQAWQKGSIFFCHHKRLHTETVAILNLKQIHFTVKLFLG